MNPSVFQRILEPNQQSNNKEGSQEVFEKANSFQGIKEGFIFTTGAQGTGYYLDKLVIDSATNKRPAEDNSEDESRLSKKRIEEIVNSVENVPVMDALDSNAVRAAVVSLEKHINKNLLQRTKFADHPPAFMESELELDEHIKQMHNLATAPEMYPILIKLDFVTSLAGLIAHENTDISVHTLALVGELTDPDTLGASTSSGFPERLAGMKQLITSLVDHKVVPLAVMNLKRLDEQDDIDAQGVHHSLSVIENIQEISPDLALSLVQSCQLLEALLDKTSANKKGAVEDFEPNRLYASEILSIFLQSDLKIVSMFMKMPDPDGMDALLHTLAQFKKRDLISNDEKEFIGNISDILCALLVDTEARKHFCELEGVELMVRLLHSTIHLAPIGAKVLSFATTKSLTNSERFIDAGGLKFVFPLLMGRLSSLLKSNSRVKVKTKLIKMELAKTLLSLIANLLTMLPLGGVHYRRLLKKFVQGEQEKMERIVELHEQYALQVSNSVTDGDIEDEAEEYLVRLESGLESLQHADIILAHLIRAHDTCRKAIETKFYENNSSLSDVRAVLLELQYHMSDDTVENTDVVAGVKAGIMELAKVIEYQITQSSTG